MFKKKSEDLQTVADEAVAQRAYEIWEARGCPEGDGSDNWQAAKVELQIEAERANRPISRLLARFRNRAALV